MQIYRKFEGFPTTSALFGLVFIMTPVRPAFNEPLNS